MTFDLVQIVLIPLSLENYTIKIQAIYYYVTRIYVCVWEL